MLKRKHAAGRQRAGFSCAWCKKAIPEGEELFTVGARAKPGVDLSAHEGTLLAVSLEGEGRGVKAVVVTNDSPAKREGYDLLFVACSESCAEELRGRIGRELEVGGGRRV
jgi:hypothetical protein